MTFGTYIKDRKISCMIEIILIVFIFFFLMMFQMNLFAIVYLISILVFVKLVGFLYVYFKKRNFYCSLQESLEGLDKKFLLLEMIERPESLEGQIFYDCLSECNKSMNDEVFKCQQQSSSYREYIEMWIHEVKTPLAAGKLIIENHPSEIQDILKDELNQIESYLDQALYYARSTSVEKDYMVKCIDLREIVESVIRSNARMLITNKIKVILNELSFSIFSDEKWIEFILQQVVINAVKYRKESKAEIVFEAREEKDRVILKICDNGIGISKRDLPKVMEKGYTGTTGRNYKQSTGMGLYLCKCLCNKLEIDFWIESKEKIGTNVFIGFPRNSMIFLK